MPDDPLWQPASGLIERDSSTPAIVNLIGINTFETSLTPRSPESAPAAIRAALRRYSTYSYTGDLDLGAAGGIRDLGDLDDPDRDDAVDRLAVMVADVSLPLIVLGGDNAATQRALSALRRRSESEWSLLTFDAHLDVRDGASNGSPVRQLIDEGLDPRRLAQVGLADFSNSPDYAQRVASYGSIVVPRSTLRTVSITDVIGDVIDRLSPDGSPVYVDLDMDVADRSVVPACPAAAPGGLSADALREIARACGRDPRVAAFDLTEIDPSLDHHELTVRLAATCVLEFVAGVAERRRRE